MTSRQVQKSSSLGPAPLRQPGHAPLEGVAVHIGEAGDGDAMRAHRRRREERRVSIAAMRPASIVSRTPRAQPSASRASSNHRRSHRLLRWTDGDHGDILSRHYPRLGQSRSDGDPVACAAIGSGANARLATLAPDRRAWARSSDGVVAAEDGRIVYAGPAGDAPTPGGRRDHRLRGPLDHPRPDRSATPTSSSPATAPREFELRLAGASYEEIARAGGGIVSTMRATRAASEAALVDSRAAAASTP